MDSLSMELLETHGNNGIYNIATLLNGINDRGQIPPDISKSIFIALPPKN